MIHVSTAKKNFAENTFFVSTFLDKYSLYRPAEKKQKRKKKLNHHCQKKKSDRKNKSSQKVLLTFRIYTSPLALNRKSNRHGFIQ